jgi:hypothetical protein
MKAAFRYAVLTAIALVAPCLNLAQTGEPDNGAQRRKAQKLMADGNWKEAYEAFAKLCLGPADDTKQVGQDLHQATSCLQQINRVNEIDDFREKVIALHQDNWRLLWAASQNYMNVQHEGFIVAGKFERGGHRGGGRYANAWERDRVRGLQLLQQALEKSKGEPDTGEVASFYLHFADQMMQYRGYQQAWRLQYLSDLSQLPDYEDGYGYYYGGGEQGAPVDEKGEPVFHAMPRSWEAAESDGQRWRWLLMQSMELDKNRKSEVLWRFASFLHGQFGVQTMAYWGRYFVGGEEEGQSEDTGIFAVHTLGQDETIAKLATGAKRFKLPDEFNFIRLYKELAEVDGGYRQQAVSTLAGIFENRRQYPEAVKWWERYRKFRLADAQAHIAQITGNWGQFEPCATHPSGADSKVDYRFRNGKQVSFAAYRLDVAGILADVKAYIKARPAQFDWEKMDVDGVGQRVIYHNQTKYIKEKVAEWDLKIEPRASHWDKRVTVTMPEALKKAGAYLVTAKMADGNVSRIVVWVNDTVIVRKPVKDKAYYFVCDAVSGKPLPKTNVEFFGYWQEWIRGTNRHKVNIKNFAEFTDADGQIKLTPKDQDTSYTWLVTATDEGGRLAYLGFNSIWYGHWYDQEYEATKVFTITDRPVYRPKQAVKFKFWVGHAKYDQEGASPYAGQQLAVEIRNPKGEVAWSTGLKADEWGGLSGEWELPADCQLGVYRVHIPNLGGGNFRVEEYKKPEFEVSVDAPTEPIMLGEKISATVKAKYYFGAPVTKGTVKYKVLRTSQDARWYPVAYWDWFYGRGYWWFGYDYDWYPGWKEWGCCRPVWWWWRVPVAPPEVVAEGEAKLAEDGTYKVEIDTGIAKAVHGDTDHRYAITAEVRDESRRTIVGTGSVLVARAPFKVYAWVDRGYYRAGDTVEASFSAQTPDGKPVAKASGVLRLLRVTYDRNRKPVEREVEDWKLPTDEEGKARIQIKAARAGQYRLSYKVTDARKHVIEGGYVFVVRGDGFDGKSFRFSHLELVTDRKEYGAGDKVRLMINTDKADGTVVLFLRPANGCYLDPEVIRLDGKSTVREIEVGKKDMPNFFVEALTVADGKLHSEMREVVVPPEKRVLDVEVLPSAEKYKPGEKAKIKVKLTERGGEPYRGSTVLSVYDKSVEYISGGSNVPEIKEFFWKWRRQHYPQTRSSLQRWFGQELKEGEIAMQSLGVFGESVADDEIADHLEAGGEGGPGGRGLATAKSVAGFGGGAMRSRDAAVPASAPMESGAADMSLGPTAGMKAEADGTGANGPSGQPAAVEPTVRKNFADTALWVAALTTEQDGTAEVELDMPENLTGWKVRCWAMGLGSKVGEGTAEVVTFKDLLLRMQSPRFFVQKDEVVLSANVHNYLDARKDVKAVLELEGGCLELTGPTEQTVSIDAKGEKRVDWRVKVLTEGEAVVRMKALTDVESDAMEMCFPVLVHGIDKMVPVCGVIRPDKESAKITLNVPAERRVSASRLEIRYSPTLAGAMVDALPYLVEYPYGCTEQTLNKFLPAVITQQVLIKSGLKLKDIRDKRANLNAQEIGDDRQRAEQWKKNRTLTHDREGNLVPYNPVFDEDEVQRMVKEGVTHLTNMQLSDGGWGWFSGWGEQSWPHTTAYVVHGLQVARENGVAIVPGTVDRGVAWLKNYQAEQVRLLKRWSEKGRGGKPGADALDAFVFMVLVDAGFEHEDMREYLYRDRNNLPVYAKSMFGMALHKKGRVEQRDMIVRNIEQFLVQDDENQTAYLNLGNGGYWWYWYGSEYEAQAYYLKLLALTDPKGEKASRLVKYLLNNRKHATYWNSTRDTAICVEAFADFMKASGEDEPDMTVEILVDGKKRKEVKIDKDNLFSFDNKFELVGDAVETGEHTVELVKKGKGPLYFNSYLSYFTLEDHIAKAGLEVKVERKYYRLKPVEKKIKAAGSRGQVLDQKVEKYERVPIRNLETLKSGELVEVELEIASKNDYEYLVFEDAKPAGFEPVEVRSGYNGNDMGAYVEFRDQKVNFFVRVLARGNHSISYRMRAEIPGKFSALPTRAYAMYAPELRANSDEIKLKVED